jgi:CBS domain-containing protein
MKVKDVMVGTPVFCWPATNLGAAVELLWNANCGILPVANEEGKVIGVVTERDICMALGTRNRLPGEITVGEVTSGEVFACFTDDDIQTALGTMVREKVRRLPVLGKNRELLGILSLDDVVYDAEAPSSARRPELSYEDVVRTYKAISQHAVPELARQQYAAV